MIAVRSTTIEIIATAAALILLVPVACASDNHPIENGTYFAQSGEDRVSVQDDEIHFVVTVTDEGQQRVLEKTYNYTVLPNGRIQPYPWRSEEILLGIGRFDWFWDGHTIIQKDRRADGEVINTFVRRP